MVWVFISAVLAASVVEDEVLKRSGLTPMNIEATQALRGRYRTPEAQGKAERLMDIVGAITRGKGITAGTRQMYSRLSGSTVRNQRNMNALLQGTSPQELNFILCAVNAAALVDVLHASTVEMLIRERLCDLSTIARAVLVDALQKVGLRYRPQRQYWARDIIVATKGIELTHLKAYMDDGGDYHTMYKLLYHDLQGSIQKAVADHITKEGQVTVSEFAKLVPGSTGVALKVLSDIDDTLFSSGGSFPAGVDSRYPRKCYYPGVLALFAELDRSFAKKHASALSILRDEMREIQFPVLSSREASPSSPKRKRSPSPDPLGGRTSSAVSTAASPVQSTERESSDALVSAPASPVSFPLPPILATRSPVKSLSRLSTPRGGSVTPAGGSPRAGIAPLWQGPWQEAVSSGEIHQEGSNLVFLSARPESYKGLTESEAYRRYFQPLVQRGELDTSPTMLLGSLDSGPRALARLIGMKFWRPVHQEDVTVERALYQTLGVKKLSRFREYAAIYPECCFVYVGDNGQGDVMAAEILTSSMRQGAVEGSDSTISGPIQSRLIATLVHQVRPIEETVTMFKKPWSGGWKNRNISFHTTHVAMATHAVMIGLIDHESLHRVAIAAVNDFRRIWSRYYGRYAGRHLKTALHQLNKDLRAACCYLPEHLQVPALCIPGISGDDDYGGGGGHNDDDIVTHMKHRGRMPPPSPARSDAGSDVSGFMVPPGGRW